MKRNYCFLICLFSTFGLTAQNGITLNKEHTQTLQAHAAQSMPGSLNGTLTPFNNSTGFNSTFTYRAFNVCGLSYVYGSVMTETRSIAANTNGTGFPATINISGLPINCSVILQAYLYYDASYTEAAAPATTATVTNPAAVAATYTTTIVGTGPQKCWGETGTASYRVDVTHAISGNGNYTINLNGFANAGKEVDGCTLFIIYQAGPTNATTGSLFIMDGATVENSDLSALISYDSITGIPVCSNTSIAQSFFLIADQTNVPTSYTSNVETANESTATFPNNQWNFNVIPTTLAKNVAAGIAFYPYRNDAFVSNNSGFDCYNWIMLGMYYQNTGCVDCMPTITPIITNITCNGTDIGEITANVSGGTSPYEYTWNTGATNMTVTGLSAGTYTISVEDAICNTASTTAVVTQPTGISITSYSISTTLGCNGIAAVTTSGGATPYTYLWTTGSQTTDTIKNQCPGNYCCTVTDKSGCSKTVCITIACINNYSEPICIVTIDTVTNKSDIIWGRTSSPPAGGSGSFNIYKESNSTYSLIHSQALDSLSEFVDNNSNPSVATQSYKLSTVDSCGESALSAVHTSILLTTTTGTNVYILNWSAYVGFTPSVYRIFRGPSMSKLVQIDSVSNTVLTYHDTLPPTDVYYAVEAVNPSGTCVATPHTPTRVPTTSLSGSFSNGFNTGQLITTGIKNIGNIANLNMYPSPSNGVFTLSYFLTGSANVRMTIVNELGQIVYDKTESRNPGIVTEQLNLESLSSGVYSLRMQTDNNIIVRKIIIMAGK